MKPLTTMNSQMNSPLLKKCKKLKFSQLKKSKLISQLKRSKVNRQLKHKVKL